MLRREDALDLGDTVELFPNEALPFLLWLFFLQLHQVRNQAKQSERLLFLSPSLLLLILNRSLMPATACSDMTQQSRKSGSSMNSHFFLNLRLE